MKSCDFLTKGVRDLAQQLGIHHLGTLIFDFLKARKVTTHESIATRDMFYAIWAEDAATPNDGSQDYGSKYY